MHDWNQDSVWSDGKLGKLFQAKKLWTIFVTLGAFFFGLYFLWLILVSQSFHQPRNQGEKQKQLKAMEEDVGASKAGLICFTNIINYIDGLNTPTQTDAQISQVTSLLYI